MTCMDGISSHGPSQATAINHYSYELDCRSPVIAQLYNTSGITPYYYYYTADDVKHSSNRDRKSRREDLCVQNGYCRTDLHHPVLFHNGIPATVLLQLLF